MAKAFTDRELRDALSAFSTGVTIVTAVDEHDRPIGMTASSFNSVSMDPPLVLWSVTKSALSADAFKNAGRFAIHVLSSDQVELSNRFAQTGLDKFTGVDFDIDGGGVPVLNHCASRFDCSVWACYEGGDHWIIVGRVDTLVRNNAEPLIFSGGSYAVSSPLRTPIPEDNRQSADASPIDGLLIYNLARAYRQIADQFHEAVRDSGLSVSEWRVLASLHGGVVREQADLAVRTFVNPAVLPDLIDKMQDNGLCVAETVADQCLISETAAGHERVKHLFSLSLKQEQAAVGENPVDLKLLIEMLQSVISNTDSGT